MTSLGPEQVELTDGQKHYINAHASYRAVVSRWPGQWKTWRETTLNETCRNVARVSSMRDHVRRFPFGWHGRMRPAR